MHYALMSRKKWRAKISTSTFIDIDFTFDYLDFYCKIYIIDRNWNWQLLAISVRSAVQRVSEPVAFLRKDAANQTCMWNFNRTMFVWKKFEEKGVYKKWWEKVNRNLPILKSFSLTFSQQRPSLSFNYSSPKPINDKEPGWKKDFNDRTLFGIDIDLF